MLLMHRFATLTVLANHSLARSLDNYDESSSFSGSGSGSGNKQSSSSGMLGGSSNSNSNSESGMGMGMGNGAKKNGDFTDKVIDGVATYAKKQW
jgi:hypothetical protein